MGESVQVGGVGVIRVGKGRQGVVQGCNGWVECRRGRGGVWVDLRMGENRWGRNALCGWRSWEGGKGGARLGKMMGKSQNKGKKSVELNK